LEARDELVELELLEPLADGLELRGAELDQPAPLAHELERLAQAGLAGVEAADDRLDACRGLLVGELLAFGLVAHSGSSSWPSAGGFGRRAGRGAPVTASTLPSAKRSRTCPASRAPAALVTTSPERSSTSA